MKLLPVLEFSEWSTKQAALRPPTKEIRPGGLRRASAAGSAGWPSLNARLSPESPVSRPHVLRQALPAVPARRRHPRRLSVGRSKACCLERPAREIASDQRLGFRNVVAEMLEQFLADRGRQRLRLLDQEPVGAAGEAGVAQRRREELAKTLHAFPEDLVQSHVPRHHAAVV